MKINKHVDCILPPGVIDTGQKKVYFCGGKWMIRGYF